MADSLKAPADGPDGLYSDEHAPTRGQWHAIATTCLDLLGLPQPESRLDATVVLTRLHIAAESNPAPPVRAIDPIQEF